MAKVGITFHGGLVKITGEKTIEIEGSTLREVISALAAEYGQQFKDRIYDETGKLRRFVNIYINGKDIRFLGHLNSELSEGDRVSIIPAVGGG